MMCVRTVMSGMRSVNVMSSYMCPDCGERVDEDNAINGKCNWCHNGKYMYGDI